MKEIPIRDILDLHTIPARDVKVVVEEYLYQCSLKGYRYVRVIHGKGTGVQREMVRAILRSSLSVESFEDGPDWGSTAVVMKLQEKE